MNRTQQALQYARAELAGGTATYICDALMYAASDHPELEDVCHELMEHVAAGIAHRRTLGTWLSEQCGPWDDYSPTLHLARLAWIDKMLENLQ